MAEDALPSSQGPQRCVVCDEALSPKAFELGVSWHKKCRPVTCLGCGRAHPKRHLRKFRCPACRSEHSQDQGRSKRELTPLEKKNITRQKVLRRQAKKLANERDSRVGKGDRFRAIVFRGGLPGQRRKG